VAEENERSAATSHGMHVRRANGAALIIKLPLPENRPPSCHHATCGAATKRSWRASAPAILVRLSRLPWTRYLLTPRSASLATANVASCSSTLALLMSRCTSCAPWPTLGYAARLSNATSQAKPQPACCCRMQGACGRQRAPQAAECADSPARAPRSAPRCGRARTSPGADRRRRSRPGRAPAQNPGRRRPCTVGNWEMCMFRTSVACAELAMGRGIQHKVMGATRGPEEDCSMRTPCSCR